MNFFKIPNMAKDTKNNKRLKNPTEATKETSKNYKINKTKT